MTVAGIDVSNWQSTLSAQQVQCFRDAGIRHAVVRASLESMRLVDIAKQQIGALQTGGIDVAGYIWVYPSWQPVKTMDDALREYGPFGLRRYWLDAEETDDVANPARNTLWLSDALRILRGAGVATGIYTGAWWWNDPRHMGGSRDFRDTDLWVAYYDNNPDLNVWTRFGGWTEAAGKQYSGTGSLCGISPLDLDVFDDAVLPQPEPPPDDRDEQIAQLTVSKIGLRDAYTASVSSLDALALAGRTITAQAEEAARSARKAIDKWGA